MVQVERSDGEANTDSRLGLRKCLPSPELSERAHAAVIAQAGIKLIFVISLPSSGRKVMDPYRIRTPRHHSLPCMHDLPCTLGELGVGGSPVRSCISHHLGEIAGMAQLCASKTDVVVKHLQQ